MAAKPHAPAKPVCKPSSGHYGVHVPCSLVTDESSPNSSNDSDIEELDGPPPSSFDFPSNKSHAIKTSLQLPALSSVTSFLFNPTEKAPLIEVASRSSSPLPCNPSSSPVYDPYSPRVSPPGEISLFPPWRSWAIHFMDKPTAPRTPPRLTWDYSWENNEVPQPSRSRSSSPMDLSSSASSFRDWPPSPVILDQELALNPLDEAADHVCVLDEDDTATKTAEISSVEVNAPESRQLSPPCERSNAEQQTIDPAPPSDVTKAMLVALEEKIGGEIAAVQSTVTCLRVRVS